ncbi:MAG: Uma2 family endonuclease [Cyanobacteria bacterium P01_F01_bin.86]
MEFVEGQVIDMATMQSSHAVAMDLIDAALRRMFGIGYYVRQRKPFVIPNSSEPEPEPDVAVVQGLIRDYTEAHPSTAKLLVEVADTTTLLYDRDVKGSLYAKASVPEYWVLNLGDRQLEVYSDPETDATAAYGFSYNSYQLYKSGQAAAPFGIVAHAIAIEDVLP